MKQGTIRSESTREHILKNAWKEIYEQGLHNASLERIARGCGLTKGALFHYFDSKDALVFGVLRDVMHRYMAAKWFEPLLTNADPLEAVRAILRDYRKNTNEQTVCRGCPLQNLAHDVTFSEPKIQTAIKEMFFELETQITVAFRKAAQSHVDVESIGRKIVASFYGAVILGKVHRSKKVFDEQLENLERDLLTAFHSRKSKTRSSRKKHISPLGVNA